MMRALSTYPIPLALLLFFFQCISAAEITHLPGLSLGVEEHSILVPSGSKAGSGYGVGGLLSADYAFTANHFMMSMGVGASVWQSTLSVEDGTFSLPGSVDRNGYEFTFVYETTRRRDAYSGVSLQVPLMFGGMFNRVYFLVGGKFLYHVPFRPSVKMSVRTWGDYPQFLDPFTGMPNHQYFDLSTLNRQSSIVNSQSSTLNNIDAAVSAELGFNLASASSSQLSTSLFQLSLYADFGLLNYARERSLQSLIPPAVFSDVEGEPNMVERLTAIPVLSTQSIADGVVRHLAVGIKFTVRFPSHSAGSAPSRRYPCRCLPDDY